MLRHVVHSRCRCNTSKAALIDASRSASCIRSIEKRDMQYRHYECTTRHRCRATGSAPGPTWAQSLSMPVIERAIRHRYCECTTRHPPVT